jgi:hypothetical protein
MSGSPLLNLARRYALAASPNLLDSECTEAVSILERYIKSEISFQSAAALYRAKFRTSAPVDRIREILEVSPESLPSHGCFSTVFRRKNQQWSPIEDTRLLSAIHRFGTDNWNLVAQFVGNNRTRSQCSQRWQRGLDPRISRSRWTPEEEAKLLQLVEKHGQKSWIRISATLGNRSDVQCRYRYHQILRGRSAGPVPTDVEEVEEVEETPTVESGKEEEKEEDSGERSGELGMAIEAKGLELGTNSMSEIFWMLHQ